MSRNHRPADTSRDLLATARDQQAAADRAQVDILIAAADYAAYHSPTRTPSLSRRLDPRPAIRLQMSRLGVISTCR